MFLKNTILKTLASFPHKHHTITDPEKPHFLIVSTTGVGDSLWGTPAIRALKKTFPKASLSILTSPIGSALFKNSPYIDTLYTLTDPALRSCIRLFSPLKKNRIEVAIFFHHSQRPLLPFVSLLGPSQLIGTKGQNKGLDSLLTQTLFPQHEHEIKRRIRLVQMCGAKPDGAQMELFLTDPEKEKGNEFLKKTTFPIGIHPGAKDRFKQWAPHHFICLGKRLQKEYGAEIFVTGGKEEKALANHVAAGIPHARSLAGQSSLRETAALIGNFSLFLTNDTGPMHIAYAMKTPTFSLFAPTDQTLCGPYQISHAAPIQKAPTCFPCIRKKCRVPFCLEQISEDEAWKQIQKLIDV